MSKKVIAIAAGEAHTLALTADGAVYSWGRGTFGRLGTAADDDQLFPVPISCGHNLQPNFVGIATGAYHSLALRDDGSVWSWGYNIYGQLGRGEENSSIPSIVGHFQELGPPDAIVDESSTSAVKTPLKICAVKAGGMTSLAIDSYGALWMWGNCPQAAEDGQFCISHSNIPQPVWDFHGHTVVKVACGNEHVVAAVSAEETYTGGDLICYAWGSNNHGQLGLGDKENRSRPEVISTFNQDSPWAVYEIACGAFHTAILTNKKSYGQELESKCWTFGLGENGQLGHGTTSTKVLPEPVDALPQDAFLISIDCGLFHTSVVSSAGDVWSWGMEKGLGLCPDASFTGSDPGDAHLPLRIQAPDGDGVRFPGAVQVACGAAHTVLVAGDGYKLWAWGRGRSGALGRGQTTDSYIPCTVLWPPLHLDFEGEQRKTHEDRSTAMKPEVGPAAEMDRKLSAALEEVEFLKSKLTIMERYASMLHISIFRKALDERTLPKSLLESGVFDIRKELDNMMEKADGDELARLEMFYRSMLSGVKDKLMKRRVQEVVKEYLFSLSSGRQH